jgi:hypothetical protein
MTGKSHVQDKIFYLGMDYETIKPGTWSVSGIGGTNLSVHGRGNVPIITEVKHNNYSINNEI